MARIIGLAILLASFASVSTAGAFVRRDCNIDARFDKDRLCKIGKIETIAASEIDPTSAMAGLTLLVGGLVVLRGRRTKNSEA
jgi:hypothetical protein